MQKRQIPKKYSKQLEYSSSSQPILCDGCNTMISQDNYITHWQKCILTKKRQQKNTKFGSSQVLPINKQKVNTKQEQKQQKSQETVLQVPCIKCGVIVKLTNAGEQLHNCAEREQQCVCGFKFPHYLIKQHQNICDFYKSLLNDVDPCYSSPSMIQNYASSRYSSFHDSSQPIRSQNTLNSTDYQDSSMHTSEMYYGPNWEGHESSQNNDLLQEFFNMLKPKQRVSDQDLRSLKRIKYHEQMDQDCCTICQEKFKEGMQIVQLDCSHIFHPHDITSWLKENVTCPNCKTKVRVNKTK